MTAERLDQRVCAYYRVSTGKQAEADLSIPDQRKQIHDYCKNKGWAIVAEFVEPGASAKDDNRPEFQKMIERACEADQPFDIVLVHSYSRFFRDSFGMEMYFRKLRRASVQLVSMTQEFGTDPAHMMMRQIISMFDEYQSRETSKHVSRTMKENARQGFYNGAPCPLGYKAEAVETRGGRAKKKMVIDPPEAETVKLIFKLYLIGDGSSGPLGLKGLVNWLNERGYRTRKGARFGVGTVRWILTNPVYTGSHIYNRRSHRASTANPPSEHIIINVPAIITQQEFDAVRLTLQSRNPRVVPPRLVTSPILLSGLAICGFCKGAMAIRTGTSRSGKIHRYYSCSKFIRQGKTACKGQSIAMEKLDGLVVKHLVERLFELDRLTALLSSIAERRKRDAAEIDARITALRNRVNDTESKLTRLYQLVENGGAEVDDILANRLTTLRADHNIAKQALERLLPPLECTSNVNRATIQQFCTIMRANLTEGSLPFRKAYIRAVVDRIEVGNKVVTITGAKSSLERAFLAKGTVSPGVRIFARKWCPSQPTNRGSQSDQPDLAGRQAGGAP